MLLFDPIRFTPLFRRYLWGGDNLARLLGKACGAESCAESWEICDHGDDQSVVPDGVLAGKSLAQLVQEFGTAVFGPGMLRWETPQQRFPLLYKFLDARLPLSVQVHPDDKRAALLAPPDLGKTEAWIVIAAQPDSRIYAGLQPGCDRRALERALAAGDCESCLHSFVPRVGDCVFIPAGTVHALGAGLVIAEIQQSSDTTWRLFDWNRLGPDGRARPLQIAEALDVIDYSRGPVFPVPPRPTEHAACERLVECDKFVLDRWQFDDKIVIPDDDRFHILSVLAGEITIHCEAREMSLPMGSTVLLPAQRSTGALTPRPSAVVLDAYLP